MRVIVLALLAGSCGDDSPTGMVVDVRTDLNVPADLDALKVFVRKGDKLLHQRDFKLGTGEGKLQLPASLALVTSQEGRDPVKVEVQGFLGPQLMIARSVHERFIPGQVRNIGLLLGADCLGVYCLSGKTCESGRGCVAVDGSAAMEPPAVGPPCDCNSYFPVCRGASWNYVQRDLNRNIPIKKSFVIQDYADLADNAHSKAGVKGFLQFRLVEGGLSRRWMTIEGASGAGRLSYEKDEWFDNNWGRTLITYFVPGRPRLDESHTGVGDVWTVDYEQFDYRPNMPAAPGWRRTDEWMVVSADEQPGLPKRWREPLCQRRFGQEFDLVTDQVYCFVRGVGKVYEITAGDDEDVLMDYRIPGCGEVLP